jgi:NAD(P)-dependent dehydrogenase (short-subunit alcohol dehydrogenase family)
MNIAGRVVVVTGGAQGIGAALCRRFHKAGAKAVVVADIDIEGAKAVARSVQGVAFACDVADEARVVALIDETERQWGGIDLFCSNAGIARFDPDSANAASSPNADWQQSWNVNVMAHVYAARALMPRMAARGGGHMLITVSAAGLLSQIGGAVYATTKHAALGFAESLAITHFDQGIRVSVLCPQGVDTPMLRSLPPGPQALDGVMSADDVAAATAAGLEQESFLILPHAEVLGYMRNKARDYDRWIAGMVKLRRKLQAPDFHAGKV